MVYPKSFSLCVSWMYVCAYFIHVNSMVCVCVCVSCGMRACLHVCRHRRQCLYVRKGECLYVVSACMC